MNTQANKAVKLAAGRTIKEFPYYGPALERVRFNENDKVDTMCIDGKLVINYNPDFVTKNQENLTTLIVHEIMHYISNHHARHMVNKYKDVYSYQVHNICMDMEINQHLKKNSEWITRNGILPNGGNPDFEYPEGKSYEEYMVYFDADIKKFQKNHPNLCQNQGQSSNGSGNGDDKNQSQGKNNSNSSESEEGNDSQQSSNSGTNQSSNPNGNSNGSSGNSNQGMNPSGGGGSGSSNNVDRSYQNTEEYKNLSDKEKMICDGLNTPAGENDKVFNNGVKEDGSDTSGPDKLSEACEAAERERSNQIGSGSGNELFRKVPTKKYSWDKVFRKLIASKKSDLRKYGYSTKTYTKFNRRLNAATGGRDILFPSSYDEEVELDIVVGIDVSGSMGNLIDEMYARLKSITKVMNNKIHVTLLECDSYIEKVVEDFDKVIDNKEVSGFYGGGTDMDQIPKWVKEKVDAKERLEPDMIVIMTDNYVSWGEPIPELKKKIVVLSDQVTNDCPYTQKEVIIN